MTHKARLAILQNEHDKDHQLWVDACREHSDSVDWEVVDITRSDWLERLLARPFDGLLARPPAYTMPFKTLYDERVRILNQVCGIPVYPSLEEIEVYENKKYLSYSLAATGVPHPETHVFYYEKEALAFLEKAALPIVGKSNIGASGRGVAILKSKQQAVAYVQQTFSGKGASRSTGPNWKKKGFVKRALKKVLRPQELRRKLDQYQAQKADVQKDFVLFQAFIPHSYEWRCVRIGDSFFAHKKMVKGEMASGSLVKGYDTPPPSLLDFVRKVTDRRGFLSQAVDLFETADGKYLVNEMQCIFGQSDPYQMLIDGQAGRYRFQDGSWVFEAGDFNRLESYELRLAHFLSLLSQQEITVSS